jgi:hypothetical protein
MVSITWCTAECDPSEQRPDLTHPQVRPPVSGHQQHPVSQAQRPLTARTAVGDFFATTVGDTRTSLRNWTGRNPVHGSIHSGLDDEIT